MIALTISDCLDAHMAVLRVSELSTRKERIGVPEAICIRNDSFSEEQFTSMTELIGKIWNGTIILESDDPTILAKAVIPIADRKPILVGANANDIEQLSMIASMFDCPLCVGSENLEELFDLAVKAEESGVQEVIMDPMMKNMKQCLETCTEIQRISQRLGMDYRIAVRTWSGEYAMTMASVSLLIGDALVIVDDLDEDSCETLSALISSVRR